MDIVEDLRLNHEYCPKDVILQAADEIERLRRHIQDLRELRELERVDKEALEIVLNVLEPAHQWTAPIRDAIAKLRSIETYD